jgi:NADH-quinone oxidoreductase subunit G
VRQLKIPEWRDAREAVQKAKGPVFIATPCDTRLDDLAKGRYHGAPDDIARLGLAVARVLNATLPKVAGLPEETLELAAQIAADLKAARKPLIVSGISLGSTAILGAANGELGKEGHAQTQYRRPECNTLTRLLGGAAERLRQGKQGHRGGAENNLPGSDCSRHPSSAAPLI